MGAKYDYRYGNRWVMKPTVASVKSQVDTHEAVCAERWKETIVRIKRLEMVLMGQAATLIVLLVADRI